MELLKFEIITEGVTILRLHLIRGLKLSMIMQERLKRYHYEKGDTTFSDDAERVYQSFAFRRLAGVTQVIAATENGVYHNRLTHSIKVSRLARLIATKLLEEADKNETLKREIRELGGLDINVVEAASLAHDIGHPPFGHCGEQELNDLVLEYGKDSEDDQIDGFEGNAQSFRIVTKIIPRHSSFVGLNLTRATLNALLKYPWLEGKSAKNSHKYGVYKTESKIFDWVRKPPSLIDNTLTLEAEIMDWADDVAYAFHDLEDFLQAQLINLSEIFSYSELPNSERGRHQRDIISYVNTLNGDSFNENPEDILLSLVRVFPFLTPHDGTREKQRVMREVFSSMIERSIKYFRIKSGKIDKLVKSEIEILKQLTVFYVINSRSLQTQQHGYRKVLRYIFEAFFHASEDRNKQNTVEKSILPLDFWDLFDEELSVNRDILSEKYLRARIVADSISRMTDEEALTMYQRLSGNAPGSVFDKLR